MADLMRPAQGRRIAFWVSADTKIGGGHVMRCLCLADVLARTGADCTFFVNEAAPRTVAALARAPYRMTIVAHGARSLVAAADQVGPLDWIIVDDYRLDAASETPLRAFARQVMVIDDMADRPHDCDLLLDSVLGRRESDYDGLMPEKSCRLTGQDYVLLRPEFALRRGAALARRRATVQPCSILVSFGLMDPDGIAGEAAVALVAAFPQAQIRLVLGTAAGSTAKVREIASVHRNLEVLVDPPSMSDLMAGSHIAVGAGGSTAWERACLGLPSVAIVLAENQVELAREFERQGGAVAVQRDAAVWRNVENAVRRMMDEPDYWQELSRKASLICDGLGAARASLRIFPEVAKDGAVITLRRASWEDCDRMLGWQSEPGMRRFSTNPQPPGREEHEKWTRHKLADPGCVMTIIERSGEPVGVLRFDCHQDHSFMTSILITEACNGRGVATAALRAGVRLLEYQTIWAMIDDRNAASRGAFAKVGFLPLGNGKYKHLGKAFGALS